MRCRETLLSFAHAMADDQLVVEADEPPKLSDFVRWAELVADAVAPGRRNSNFRSYLKMTAKQSWDYVSWLTHEKNATRLDGSLAVTITAHVLYLYEKLIYQSESGVPERCPSCGSYRVEPFWTREEDRDELVHVLACEACEWTIEIESQSLQRPSDEDKETAVVEGECLLSSDLGPGVSFPLR